MGSKVGGLGRVVVVVAVVVLAVVMVRWWVVGFSILGKDRPEDGAGAWPLMD